MGGKKGRRGGKKNRDSRGGGYANQKKGRDDGDGYTDIVRENEKFDEYYKRQNFFNGDEEEWKKFKTALETPLPSTFRITGTKESAAVFLNMIEKRFMQQLIDVVIEGEVVQPPAPIDFYPDRLAWGYNVARRNIRKSPDLQKFHKFLVAMNEKGYLSRQEAVSMIPPLVLDVKPEHTVLDMCAAPGSKTAQLIELLHAEGPTPSGLVIANDSDNKRCYTLTHQTKRLQSPNFMVTNLDASRFPSIKMPSEDGSGLKPLEFDRILCDVPCSGDGTLRKNPKAWTHWGQMAAVGLHKLQKRIAYRGAQLLKVGGRLVYSTCSFNPVENEAVVAALLRSTKGSLELVDVSATLPDLVSTKGLSDWVVCEKNGTVLPDHTSTNFQLKKQFISSIWPPTKDEAKEMHLDRCVRVFPQQQDTGGFFIAVFQKTAVLPPKSTNGVAKTDSDTKAGDDTKADGEKKTGGRPKPTKAPQPSQPQSDSWIGKLGALFGVEEKEEAKPTEEPHIMTVQRGYKEDPYFFLKESGDFWPAVKKFYGFNDSFEAENLLSRTKSNARNIYYVSKLVRLVVSNNSLAGLRIINCGVKIITRSDAKNKPCDYRLCMEGLATVFPFLDQRVAPCNIDDLTRAIAENGAKIDTMSEGAQKGLADISLGCTVLSYVPDTKANDAMDTDTEEKLSCPLQVLIWKGADNVRTLVSKDDRYFFNILLDIPDAQAATLNAKQRREIKDTPSSTIDSAKREQEEKTSTDEPAAKKPRTDAE